jgi:hypothetical protein
MPIERHQGEAALQSSFERAHAWLERNGDVELATAAGTQFTAKATRASRGAHASAATIRFFQSGVEFARAYGCCWGRYYNCNRTRIGMYCEALDEKLA